MSHRYITDKLWCTIPKAAAFGHLLYPFLQLALDRTGTSFPALLDRTHLIGTHGYSRCRWFCSNIRTTRFLSIKWMRQIGHSPRWLSSGCLNRLSSRFRCSFLACFCVLANDFSGIQHSALQYFTSLQVVHFLSLMLSTAALPHKAHTSSNASCRSVLIWS